MGGHRLAARAGRHDTWTVESSDELRRVVTRFIEALRDGDEQAVSNRISRQPGFERFGSDPAEWWRDGEEAALVWTQQMREMGGGYPWQLTDGVFAMTEGSTGWALGRAEFESPLGPTQFRFTCVLHLEHGDWKLVQFHSSVPTTNEEHGLLLTTSVDQIAESVSAARPDLSRTSASDGTVTIVFTDIEDSTRLNEFLGDQRLLEVLRAHNDVVKVVTTDFGGTVVKNQGEHALALARYADPYRRGVRAPRPADAPAVHQDPHADRRGALARRGHLHRGDPPPARCRAVQRRPLRERARRAGHRAPDPAAGPPDLPEQELPADDLAGYLRWFIDNDVAPTGSGPYGLADYCEQIRTYWDAREAPNVHLFHYADLWAEREVEMRWVASVLRVPIDEDRWPAFVEAAELDSMRSRAQDTAPEAHLGLWKDPRAFFRSGGTRDWASLMSPDDLAHFDERLKGLAADATGWVLDGRASLGPRAELLHTPTR
jgi:SnoaL-like domain/Sulfotransferase domain